MLAGRMLIVAILQSGTTQRQISTNSNKFRQILTNIFEEPVIQLPRAAEFEKDTFADTFARFMATAAADGPLEAEAVKLFPTLLERLQGLQREGSLRDYHLSAPTSPDWRGFLFFRERTEAAVREICQSLPLAAGWKWEITPVMD